MGVNAIAQALEMIPSTCLHILRVLAAEGLVVSDPATKRYSPGPGLLVLARGVGGPGSFGALAQPALDGLTAQFGLTAIGVEAVGLESMIVIAMAGSACTSTSAAAIRRRSVRRAAASPPSAIIRSRS